MAAKCVADLRVKLRVDGADRWPIVRPPSPVQDMNSSAENHVPGEPRRPGWRLPLLLAMVLAAMVFLRAGVREDATENIGPAANARENDGTTVSTSAATEPVAGQVTLAIDFGGGKLREFQPVAWRKGMTVADLMGASIDRDRSVQYSREGAGAMAFLTEIGDVANEGAGGQNWTYTVNGTTADRSYAVYELHAGDRVLWSFAAPE